MTTAELQELEEIKALITKGQTLGVLTYGEISTAVAELDLDDGDLEEFHHHLESTEIELIDDPDPAAAAGTEERASDKRGRRKPKTPLDLKPDMTTDSLQLFLKDIGKVRLLTAQEEVDLAKRIERGDLDAKQKMVESNLRLVVSIAKNYRNQGLQVLHLRHLVDPPGDRPRARRQGAHDPHPGARGREAQQDRPRRAQARDRARPRAHPGGDRRAHRHRARGGRVDQALRAGTGLAREAGRRRGGVRVRPVHRGRARGVSLRARGGDPHQGGAPRGAREPLLPRAPRARAALRARRGASAHAGRGRAHLQRHARADPSDREPVAQEAAVTRGGAEAPRRRLERRSEPQKARPIRGPALKARAGWPMDKPCSTSTLP